MGKQRYKVGDFVRARVNWGNVEAGKVYKIPFLDEDGEPWFSRNGDGEPMDYLTLDEIEPWQPRVGDRIRLVKDGKSTTGAVGKAGTISKWNDGSVLNDGDYLIDVDPPVDYETLAFRENFTRAKLDCLEPLLAGEPAAQTQPNIGTITAGVLQPSFKIGDRVRRVKGRSPGSEIGHEASISAIDPMPLDSEGPWLKFTDGTSGYATNFVLVDAKASNDNRADAGGGFMAGDRIRLISDPTIGCKIGDEFTAVARTVGHSGSVHYIDHRDQITWRPGSYFELVTTSTSSNDNGPGLTIDTDKDFNLLSKSTPTTIIVALIENGQPKPSSSPHVHDSNDAAEKEAKRLAAKFKGKSFGVFTLTTTHEETAPVYDHKWQNLAYNGLKIDAIKELRSITGMGLKPAKDAVEYFLDAA